MAEVFRQILDGDDIPTPDGMLKIKQTDVSVELQGFPYSIITNLAHAVLWQDIWLNSLHGGPRESMIEKWKNDWRVPPQSEWPSLRKEFVDGLKEAHRIAGSIPMDHKMETDEAAINLLVCIAVHSSYHMGQLNLLKRSIRQYNSDLKKSKL